MFVIVIVFLNIFSEATAQPRESMLVIAQVEQFEITGQNEKPSHRITIKTQGGSIFVKFAQGITNQAEPIEPAHSFSEDAESIFLAFKSSSTNRESIRLRYLAIDVEGYEPNQVIKKRSYNISPGQRKVFRLDPPRNGFSPGKYRVEIEPRDDSPHFIDFVIKPKYPWATRITESKPPLSYNLTLNALGGRVERVTSQRDDDQWSAANLIDGTPFTTSPASSLICERCGWASSDNTLPQEIVLSFYVQKEAEIAAVIIDPTTHETLKYPNLMPKHVEVWVSSESVQSGFQKVASARLHQDLAEQIIALPKGTSARFVKLVLTSNFGGRTTRIAEIKVMEANSAQKSILDDRPMNLARPEIGGVLTYFSSSSDKKHSVGRLIDGDPVGVPWQSSDDYLPQEFVFAFRGDQQVLIDRVMLSISKDESSDNRPRRVSISVAYTSPLDEFVEIGTFDLDPDSEKQAVPVGRLARFVKVRILENFGGSTTTLNEITVIEGSAVNYTPLLLRPDNEWFVPMGAANDVIVSGMKAIQEVEPNDSRDQANPLSYDQFTRGTIDPFGENDYFSIAPEAIGSSSAITFELIGMPNIRTSLTLSDADGQSLKNFDPGALPKTTAEFSWALTGEERYLQLTEPPLSVVLIWDTSGSMKGRTEDLQRAVLAYIDQVPMGQRINLIRFSNDVEVLLDDFTTDKNQLRAVIQDKFSARGSTRFYDAVSKAIELLEKVPDNRAIVVMTDGEDHGSRLKHPDFWHLLKEKRIRIYTIGLGQRMKQYLPQFGSTGKRILDHISLATNGYTFYAEESDELTAFFEKIAAELHKTSTYYLKPVLSQGTGRIDVVSTGEKIDRVTAPQVELILDASGSMRERKNLVNGQLKIELAKDVLRQVIEAMAVDTHVALRVYGRKIREGRKGDCKDTELLYPFSQQDKDALLLKLEKIKALGTTPIAFALEQAILDFGETTGEKLIILISDGKEECGGNIQATAESLHLNAPDIPVNVVGFGLTDKTAKTDMKDIARLTGGLYFDAMDKGGLFAALENAMAAPFELLDASGQLVGRGVIGGAPLNVPEGVYKLIVKTIGIAVTVPDIRVRHGQWTRVALTKEGQEIGTKITDQPWIDNKSRSETSP